LSFFSLAPGGSDNSNILFRVINGGGGSEFIHCHIEMEGRRPELLEAELIQNSFRIYDSFQIFPTTLSLITCERYFEHPSGGEFFSEEGETGTSIHHAHIFDFNERSGELLYSTNPFAFATRVQLEKNILRSKRRYSDSGDKMQYALKKRLLRSLLTGNYGERYLSSLFIFLDWMLPLSGEFEIKLSGEFGT